MSETKDLTREELLKELQDAGDLFAYIDEWCNPGDTNIIENYIRPYVVEAMGKIEKITGQRCRP